LNPQYYKGKKFTITTLGNSKQNVYVQQMKLNGDELHEPVLPFSEFAKGGKLELQMGSTPKDKY
jgi:putative alpha-1,2-mannosidase